MKNKSGFYIILSVILIIIVAFSLSKYSNSSENLVCYNSNCIKVEIANTPESRAIGLMNRPFLDDNSGMLFVFPESGIHNFWMKKTLIPLDIIWLDEAGEVVYIANAVPCTTENCYIYAPSSSASYVLEINAGKAEKLDIEVGKKVDIKV